MTFLLTFILNYLTSYIFWKDIFKKRDLAFLGSLLTVFSPFFHTQLGHFQLQSYWPTFLSLYFIFRYERNRKINYLIWGGVFIAIQFLASVYIAVFLITTVCLYYLILIIKDRNLTTHLKNFVIVMGIFLVICSPVIYGYLNIQKVYQVDRNYGEYVTYSAHLSDYIFSREIKSATHSLAIVKKWNSFNKHNFGEGALFPGFLLTILGMLGIVRQKHKSIRSFFFLTLVCIGFIFSLGPRINFNGVYAEIPLPYHFLLKYLPFIDVIRAPARWSFLFYIGLTYFCLSYLNKKTTGLPLFLLLFILIVLEYIPLNIQTHKEVYIHKKDQILKDICSFKVQTVLEIPVTHFDAGDSIFSGLSYITKTILASTYHKCNLVNGYTSYDLPSIQKLKNSIYDIKTLQDPNKLYQVLRSSGANIVVINKDLLLPEISDQLLSSIEKLTQLKYLVPYGDYVFQIRVSGE